MRRIGLFMILLLSAAMPDMAAPLLPAFLPAAACDRVLDMGYYTVCYDDDARGPRFVVYELDGANVDRGNIRKRPHFHAERRIPERVRSHPEDYRHNGLGLDRGHLAPDAAFDFSQTALKSVYSMVNIVPQALDAHRIACDALLAGSQPAATAARQGLLPDG